MRLIALISPLYCALCAQAAPQFVWQGQVDGIAILHLQGNRLAVQIQEGAPVEEQKYRLSGPLPGSAQQVRIEVLEGRGYVHVIDQPGIENHYTLAVAIEDRQLGSGFYSIALYWDVSDRRFEGESRKTDRVTWRGLVDEDATISCQRQSCVSTVSAGASVADEHFKFLHALPGRDSEVRLEHPEGRGAIRLIEQPIERNNYTVRVSIRDPQAGAGEYSFTLLWDRIGSKQAAKESGPIPAPTGRGFLWSGTVDGLVRVTVQGGASFSEILEGTRVVGEHGEVLRPLPARAGLTPAIEKLHGRGRVSIVELPSERNNYRLIFEIDDSEPGGDYYDIELDW